MYINIATLWMSLHTVMALHWVVQHHRPFPLEVVFLTGILAQAVGLRPKDHPGFSFKRRDLDICSVRKTITTHGVSSREMVDVWRRLKEGKDKDCPGGRGWAARTHLTGDC